MPANLRRRRSATTVNWLRPSPPCTLPMRLRSRAVRMCITCALTASAIGRSGSALLASDRLPGTSGLQCEVYSCLAQLRGSLASAPWRSHHEDVALTCNCGNRRSREARWVPRSGRGFASRCAWILRRRPVPMVIDRRSSVRIIVACPWL